MTLINFERGLGSVVYVTGVRLKYSPCDGYQFLENMAIFDALCKTKQIDCYQHMPSIRISLTVLSDYEIIRKNKKNLYSMGVSIDSKQGPLDGLNDALKHVVAESKFVRTSE